VCHVPHNNVGESMSVVTGTAATADCPLLQRVMPIDKRSFVLALLEINPSMCDRMAIGIVGNACV
jgi:hypothetical protein